MKKKKDLKPPIPSILSSIPSRFILSHDDLSFGELVGSGGCGEVYLGKCRGINEPVAIKKLFVVEMDETNLNLFAREVKIHAIIQHNFLVPLVGFTLSFPFTIVTKYVPNGSLYDALHSLQSEKALTPTNKTCIAYAVASGMDYLHRRGVIHRDLKSPNVLLDENMLPKICDFGLSRTHKLATSMTKAVGTPQWMAPELVNGKEYDDSIDVYSYGVVLWEMLTNQIPYSGMDTYQIVYALSVNSSENEELLSIPEDAPELLAKLIRACLSFKPGKRPKFSEIMEFIEKGAMFQGTNISQFDDFLLSVPKAPVRSSFSARKAHTDPVVSKDQTPLYPSRYHLDTSTNYNAIGNNEKLNMSHFQGIIKKLKNLSSEALPQIQEALDYLEANDDYYNYDSIPLWDYILNCLVNQNNLDPKIEKRINKLLIKWANNEKLLNKIRFIKNISQYFDSKTLDVFFYIINVFPDIINDDFISKLKILILRKDSTARFKSIVFLCKICSISHLFKKDIIEFFLSIVEKFVDIEGGHLIFRQLFSDWVNSEEFDISTKIDVIVDLAKKYFNSSINNNIISAYHIILTIKTSTNISDDVLNICPHSLVLKHLKIDSFVSDCALDYIQSFYTDFTPDFESRILQSFISFNNEKAVLLLCKIQQSKNNVFLDEKIINIIFQTKKNKATSLFKAILTSVKIIEKEKNNKEQNYLNIIKEHPNFPVFLSEILKHGDLSTFSGIIWLLLLINVDHNFIDKLDNYAILHLLSQRFKDVKNPQIIKLGCCLFSTISEIRYSTSFSSVVQTLVKHIDNNGPASNECIKALSVLSLHKELKSVFNLYNVSSKLASFIHQDELKDYIYKIDNAIL